MISLMLLPVKSETSHQKYKHNVIATELKNIWNKYTDNETMKIASSSEICATMYCNGSCVLLFGKK